MRVVAAVLLFAVYVECGRKAYVPVDKNANVDFINMEGGGAPKPGGTVRAGAPTPAPVIPPKPAAPAPQPITIKPVVTPATPAKPAAPATPAKPAVPAMPATPASPTPISPPAKPAPPQIPPKPVNPAPARNPTTTPGPGSVKALVNFYDSQGKASNIRPYNYSQAVKQG